MAIAIYKATVELTPTFETLPARFCEISWEMARSGDWLTPRLNFIRHFHKPPLTYWLVGGSLRLLGKNEFAARLPGALAALLVLWLVARWQSEVSTSKIDARLTPLLLACCLEFWALARTVTTDIFLCLTVVLALRCAWGMLNASSSRWSLGFYLALGVSTIVKGPVGPAIVALTLLPYRWLRPNLAWGRFKPDNKALLFLAIAFPWYLLVVEQNSGLLTYLLKNQLLERVATTHHGRGGPMWYYLPVFALGALPWTLTLPGALRRAWRRRDDFDVFLACWLIGPAILFSLSGSKLPTYILPLFPTLAFFLQRSLDDPITARSSARCSSATLMLLGLATFVLAISGHGAIPLWRLLAIASPLLLAGLAGFSLARSSPERSLVAVSLGSGTALLLLAQSAHLLEDRFSAYTVANEVSKHTASPTVVAEVSTQLYGLPYYLERRIVHVAYSREIGFEAPHETDGYVFPDIPSFLRSVPPACQPIVIMCPNEYRAESLPGWSVVRAGRWLVARPPVSRANQLE